MILLQVPALQLLMGVLVENNLHLGDFITKHKLYYIWGRRFRVKDKCINFCSEDMTFVEI